jgi:hypothetical protein
MTLIMLNHKDVNISVSYQGNNTLQIFALLNPDDSGLVDLRAAASTFDPSVNEFLREVVQVVRPEIGSGGTVDWDTFK